MDSIKNIIKNRHVNIILTSILIFVTLYFILISIFHRNILHPFKESSFGIGDIPTSGSNITERAEPPKYGNINSIFSIFILWIFALIFGKAANYLFLPPLLGQMIAGILFSNISFFHQFLLIDKEWETFIRQTAFIWILIRASFGLKHHILKKNLFTCASLGFFTTLIEVIGITLVSCLLFGLPAYVAVAFGFVLASTSPAVTVPVMIKLQNEDRGTSKGVPTVILASATLDNLFCITCFYILMATFTAKLDDSLTFIIIKIMFEVILSAVFGGILGFILWWIPSKNIGFYHFSRFVCAVSVSLGFYFLTYTNDLLIAGPLIVCITCAIASYYWKKDNHHGTAIEEHAFHISWIIVFQPLLFAFIGVFFDFSVFTWKLLFDALTILGIGILIRIIAVFLFVLCSKFNFKEKLFASICFAPKATVQAALAPPLAFFILSNMETKQYANLVLQTCILSILITAPIGEFLILLLGRLALSRTHTVSDAHPPPPATTTKEEVETIPIETFQQHTYTKVDEELI